MGTTEALALDVALDTATLSESFEQVFRRVLPRALAVARRILANEMLAEDAAADALARVHASWNRLGRSGYAEAWILRVTTNVAVDIPRSRRRLPARSPGQRLHGVGDLG